MKSFDVLLDAINTYRQMELNEVLIPVRKHLIQILRLLVQALLDSCADEFIDDE